MRSNTLHPRREFLRAGLGLVGSGIGIQLLNSCKEEEEGQEVSPPEDLMQEHGLLNRVLLIYDHCLLKLDNKLDFDKDILYQSAGIIRTFVEDYHEKQEENYLFPRFEKANTLTELVKTLRTQHDAGRKITEHILTLSKRSSLTDMETETLARKLKDFISMYRPHEAREDTVLFPAFRKIVSKHEYDSLGEEFEKNEHRLFGKDGFEHVLEKVSAIEKRSGIYELDLFTPKT